MPGPAPITRRMLFVVAMVAFEVRYKSSTVMGDREEQGRVKRRSDIGYLYSKIDVVSVF